MSTLDAELSAMWRRIYAQARAAAQQVLLEAFGQNLRGGKLDGSTIGGSQSIPPSTLPLATSSTVGAVKPDNSSIRVSGGVLSAAAGGAAMVDSMSLVDHLRGGLHSGDLFDVSPDGVREFFLLYYNGYYYFFHSNATATYYLYVRRATTLVGLASASDSQIITNGVYSCAVVDTGGSWHVWVVNLANNHLEHYTSSIWNGAYTLADTVSTGTWSDPGVAQNPATGTWYLTYKQLGSPYQCGCASASSLSGPWTDLGLTFAGSVGAPAYTSAQQSDPFPIFWNNRVYIAFGASTGVTSTSLQRIGIVEVDPTSMQAIAPPVVLVEALETWQQVGDGPKVFNPSWLARPDQPGRECLFYAQDPYLTGTAAGWGYVQVGPPPPDGRRIWDCMRLDASAGLDLATGLQATAQGGATWGPLGLVCSATPSGAYGPLNLTSLSDFTLAVEFSLASLPSGNGLLLRASPSSMGSNEAAIWVTNSGLLQAKVYGSTTLTLNGVTTLTTGTVYRALLRRLGSEVRLYLNMNEETSGTQGDTLSGLTEWSVANDKGASQAAGEQLSCTIYSAAVCGEALPLSADPLGGPACGGGSSATDTDYVYAPLTNANPSSPLLVFNSSGAVVMAKTTQVAT